MEEIVYDIIKIATTKKGHLMVYVKNFNTAIYISAKDVVKIENQMVVFKNYREKEKLKRFLSVNYSKERDLIMGFCY